MTDPSRSGDADISAGAVAKQRLSPVAFSGSVWMLSISALTRGSGVLAQILVAWLLTERDFGLYALAISTATLAIALREGGVRQLLTRLRVRSESLYASAFWVALTTNTLLGIAIALVGPAASRFFEEPQLADLLIWIALSFPLGTPAAVAMAAMAVRMDFRGLARIQGISALVRYGGLLFFAVQGWGALSFVMPLPFVSIVEAVLACRAQRLPMWWKPTSLMRFSYILLRVRWLILGSLGLVLANYGTAATIRMSLPTAGVGVYFFGSQLLIQAGGMMSGSVASVLLPVFAPIATDGLRLRNAVLRAARQFTCLVAPVCGLIVVVFPSGEALLWGGKWAASSGVVTAFGVLQPWIALLGLSMPLQQAVGAFRSWGIGSFLIGTVSVSAAGIGAVLFREPVGIAWFAAGFTAAAVIAHATLALRSIGVEMSLLVRAVFPVWMVSLGLIILVPPIVHVLAPKASTAVTALLLGLLYIGACFGMYRFLFRSSLNDLAQALPPNVRRCLATLL